MGHWNDIADYQDMGSAAERQSSLEDFSKRRFDRIGGYSSFGGLQKRVFDRIGDASSLGGLSKKTPPEDLEDGVRQLVLNRLREKIHRAYDRTGR